MTSKFLVTLLFVLGLSVASSAAAAPPHTVTYKGTPVTTAVPSKPFTIKLQVKNIGSTTYSGVKVTFHIPDGVSHDAVSPADAQFQDDTIFWTNVPLEGGQSFYPSLTLKLESGTALKSKKNVWVEVTGTDMEATSANFSITARSATAAKTTTLSSADISTLFQSVYGRAASASELKYWLARRTDKPQRTALSGAMAYHKNLSLQH
jgi:hypothetical protein